MATIGIDYTPAYEQGGGIGRYVRELVTALSKLDYDTAYRLFVSGYKDDRHITFPPHFLIEPTVITPKWLARIWHRARIPLPVECFTGSVDLFHATDFVLPPVLPRVKTLLTVHDLSFVRVPESASPSLKHYLDRVVPRSIASASHVLADSQATKDDIVALYGVNTEKISVLLSGVDQCFSLLQSDSVLMTTRNKYHLGTFPYIFSVGTVQPRKNYGRLIQALARLRDRDIDIHLVVAGGKGWLDSPIYGTISEMRMQDYVHFIGYADDADLPALYQAATCLAFPSLYEGFGLPILEAMSSGIPVLSSNISSLPEVAGDAAILIDPYNVDEMTSGLYQLITDETLRTQLITKGRSRAQEFTWAKSASQLLGIYQNLLA